jgi:hypothetical protein
LGNSDVERTVVDTNRKWVDYTYSVGSGVPHYKSIDSEECGRGFKQQSHVDFSFVLYVLESNTAPSTWTCRQTLHDPMDPLPEHVSSTAAGDNSNSGLDVV